MSKEGKQLGGFRPKFGFRRCLVLCSNLLFFLFKNLG